MYLSRMTCVHKDRNLAVCPSHLEYMPGMLFSPKLVFARHLSWEARVSEGEVLSHSPAFHSQNSSSEVSWTFPSKTSSPRHFSHTEMDTRLGDIIEKNTFWSLRSCAILGCAVLGPSTALSAHTDLQSSCVLEKFSPPDSCCSYKGRKSPTKQRPVEMFSVLRGRSPVYSL